MITAHDYTPRKKKADPIQRVMKLVRIDARTQIEVPVTVPDDHAIARFHARYESYRRYAGQGTPDIPNTPNNPIPEEFTEYNELPVGGIAELETVVEDLTLTESE